MLLQDYTANLTGSAVVPWVQSLGYAQVYLKFYETNDGHADSTQVLTASDMPFTACAAMSLCLLACCPGLVEPCHQQRSLF